MRRAAVIMGGALGLAAAMAVTMGAPTFPSEPERPRRRFTPVPKQHGPVTDSTPESKRAKRRRLARKALEEQP